VDRDGCFIGSNSYSGLTIIGSGTLSLSSSNALAGAVEHRSAEVHLQFTSNNTEDYSGRIILSTSSIVLDTNSQNMAFAGSLVSSNTGGLTKTGSGILTLSGSNLYTGTTSVATGTLRAGVATNAFGNSSAGDFNECVRRVPGSERVFEHDWFTCRGRDKWRERRSRERDTDSRRERNEHHVRRVISGTGGLIKTGAGTQTLSGTNTYTGANRRCRRVR